MDFSHWHLVELRLDAFFFANYTFFMRRVCYDPDISKPIADGSQLSDFAALGLGMFTTTRRPE
jgi:hypothetical protein